MPPVTTQSEDIAAEQQKDPEIMEAIKFLKSGDLPSDDSRARQIALQKPLFLLEGKMLFYIDPKQKHCKQRVVLQHLRREVLSEHHSSPMEGYFAVKKTY